MSDFVILGGDAAIFNPNFGPAVVTPRPGSITGSAQSQSSANAVCVLGDESSVSVAGVPYVNAGFAGGLGTLTISALGGDQIAQRTKFNEKPAILKGSSFTALFTVTVPGQNPGTGPDPTPMFSGTGSFVTTNIKLKGT